MIDELVSKLKSIGYNSEILSNWTLKILGDKNDVLFSFNKFDSEEQINKRLTIAIKMLEA